MLSLRCARQTRSFLYPSYPPTTTAISFFSSAAAPSSSSPLFLNSITATTSNGSPTGTFRKGIANIFRDWFMSRKQPVLDQIFEILKTQNDSSADLALSRLNLLLTERLVLDLLNYGKKDVLSCLKLFDWAGRQRGFHHTRVTYDAIFRILSEAQLMKLMVEFLQNYMNQKYVHKITYHSILVIGYSLAGQCNTALQVFGRMRFIGHDLDKFAYHVLLNSLVEQGSFDVMETIAKEIRIRGFQNEVTHSIIIKALSKQKELDKGEKYLRGLITADSMMGLSGPAIATFVGALCRDNQFERAGLLVEEFRKKGLVSMEPAYGVWIRELVNAGKLDGALEFLKDKRAVDGYVPDVFRYNTLISRLLRENRFDDVLDLLVDMKKLEISPDDITMNAILCLLCKVGRMDIALYLYNSREEFGLSVNSMSYNYLINTLLGDASVDDAYLVWKNSIEQGIFPGEKTFLVIVNALCREGKHDKMRELVQYALERNIIPHNSTYDHLITALCGSNKIDDGYWVHNLLSGLNKASKKHTYAKLIFGFCKSGRAEIAARLFIESQEKGYAPSRELAREVICCICKMDNPEKLFFRFLEMQMVIPESDASVIYRLFIDGAGYARRPELARQVYEMMRRSGCESDWRTDRLLLQSFLNSENIAHALHLFNVLSMKWRKRKIWHTMIVGLCKANEVKYATKILELMRSNGITPSIECYEELIKMYCALGKYHTAVDLVNDMTQLGRPVSSFVGNMFLMHALKSRNLYESWATYSSRTENLTPACWMLGHLIGIFSGCVEGDYDDEEIEKLIQQCFHINLFTINILIRKSSMKGIEYACKYFERMCQKGYEPNRWSYDIIVHGLAKDGRNAEARKWLAEMLHKGFDPTECTQRIIT